LWPFTIDPELQKAEAHVDIDNRVVHWIWEADHPKEWLPDKVYIFKLQDLDKSLKLMFGDTWTFTIKVNGDPIYPTENNDKNGRTRSGGKPPGPSRISKWWEAIFRKFRK
jgi:hypothetical protein